MLTLTRRPGDRIQIGDQIVITVTKVSGNRACIGIEAPDEIRIVRPETLTRANPPTRISAAAEIPAEIA